MPPVAALANRFGAARDIASGAFFWRRTAQMITGHKSGGYTAAYCRVWLCGVREELGAFSEGVIRRHDRCVSASPPKR